MGGLGGLGGLPMGKMGMGGVVLVLIVLFLSRGSILSGGGGGGGGSPTSGVSPTTAPRDNAQDEEMIQFVSFVLDDIQRTWDQKLGSKYRHAKLVVFDDVTDTACGTGQAAMGPFYCPPDERVFIDLAFFRDLDRRFGAPGDFAQAYVIAHEIGHHVQHLLGVMDKMRRMQQENPREANEASIRVELMADCLAGVWGHSTGQRQLIEKGDLEEGLAAAAAVGDDRLQKQAGGRVSPESWTHGSSEQRARWFRKGLANGDINACDTFATREPL